MPDFPSWAASKPNDNPIAHISAGTRHNLAISRSGHVYSWGLGSECSDRTELKLVMCQLGLGDEEEAKVPTLVRSKVSHAPGNADASRSSLIALLLPALVVSIVVSWPSSVISPCMRSYSILQTD